MNILVTGATGALGKILIQELRKNPANTVYGAARAELTDSLYKKCDLTDQNSVLELLSFLRPSLIYHLAGSFTGDYTIDYGSNVLCVKNILDSMVCLNLKSRVLVCGSSAEYGMVSNSDNPVSENHPSKPVSVYGLTKSMQTMLCEFYVRVHALDIVLARIFNLNIPGLSQQLFVGKLQESIKKFRNGETDCLSFGNLESSRDYINAENAITQIIKIAEKGQVGEIYNVGSGYPTKILDLLKIVLSENGVDLCNVKQITSNEFSNTKIDIPIIYADMTKTGSILY